MTALFQPRTDVCCEQIKMGYEYLKNVLKFKFPELREQQAQREAEAAAREVKLLCTNLTHSGWASDCCRSKYPCSLLCSTAAKRSHQEFKVLAELIDIGILLKHRR